MITKEKRFRELFLDQTKLDKLDTFQKMQEIYKVIIKNSERVNIETPEQRGDSFYRYDVGKYYVKINKDTFEIEYGETAGGTAKKLEDPTVSPFYPEFLKKTPEGGEPLKLTDRRREMNTIFERIKEGGNRFFENISLLPELVAANIEVYKAKKSAKKMKTKEEEMKERVERREIAVKERDEILTKNIMTVDQWNSLVDVYTKPAVLGATTTLNNIMNDPEKSSALSELASVGNETAKHLINSYIIVRNDNARNRVSDVLRLDMGKMDYPVGAEPFFTTKSEIGFWGPPGGTTTARYSITLSNGEKIQMKTDVTAVFDQREQERAIANDIQRVTRMRTECEINDKILSIKVYPHR